MLRQTWGVSDLPRAALLSRDGAEIVLRPKSFEVLVHLVRHAGRVVGRHELLDAVWPAVTVTEESVTQCVREIRHALGDDPPRLIRAVVRRGYLLDVPVGSVAPLAAEPVPTGRAAAVALIRGGLALTVGEPSVERLLAERALYRQATVADPGLANAWAMVAMTHAKALGLGACIEWAHEFRLGEAAVARALALDPEEPNAYAALGNLLRQHPDRIEDAATAFRHAVALTPRAHPSRANLGWMLVLLGRAEEGEHQKRASLAAAPEHDFAEVWTFELGMIDLLLARGDHGVAALGRVVGHGAAGLDIAQVTLMFAAALAETGRPAEAEQFVAEARARDPLLSLARLAAAPLWPTRSAVFLEQQARIAAALGRVGLE
jgi:DNA-binding winged helix-turn-helix (wHTH) protein/Tfp pilus assembly protein PilF